MQVTSLPCGESEKLPMLLMPVVKFYNADKHGRPAWKAKCQAEEEVHYHQHWGQGGMEE